MDLKPFHLSDPKNLRSLVELLKIVTNPNSKTPEIIQFLKDNNIPLDIKVPLISRFVDKDDQIPLIYLACSLDYRISLVKYLLKHNIDLSTPTGQVDLLYYSHEIYIPILIKHGAKLEEKYIEESIFKFLERGNLKKLMILHHYGAITKSQLRSAIQNTNLVRKTIEYFYKTVLTLARDVDKVNDVIQKYYESFTFMFKNGLEIDDSHDEEELPVLQLFLNTYCVELIELAVKYTSSFNRVTFYHYSNFPQEGNRQILQRFYNEENFLKIKKLLEKKIAIPKIVKKKLQSKVTR